MSEKRISFSSDVLGGKDIDEFLGIFEDLSEIKTLF